MNGPAPPRRTLVVLRALGLGDLLTGVPALRALARAFPDHERVLLCPSELEPIVRATGAVHRVTHTDFRRRPPTANDMPALDAAPDVAVNLHGKGPQSHRALQALRPRRLLAFASTTAGVDGPAWDAEEHEVDRWCRLLAEHGIPAEATDLHLPVEPLRPPVPGAGPCLVLHPGASSPVHRWPPVRWAGLARAQRVLGRCVVVTGSAAERELAEHVARLADLPDMHVLAGRTPLAELAGIVAGACAVVSGDTGPANLATAVGTPSVVLFATVRPAQWGPRTDRGRHMALWRDVPRPPAPRRLDRGLAEITVEDVLGALRGARTPSRPADRPA